MGVHGIIYVVVLTILLKIVVDKGSAKFPEFQTNNRIALDSWKWKKLNSTGIN